MASLAARRCALLAALAALGGYARADDAAGPFSVRDQNPLLRGDYLPVPRPDPGEGTTLAAALVWSNTTNLPRDAHERLYVDEETAEIDLRIRQGRGEWMFAAELPLLVRGGGILDGPIDDWHAFLGVNRGDRPYVRSNAYRITYQVAGSPPASVERGAALGDVPLEVGRRLHSGTDAQLSAWLGVKLPTGQVTHGTSNGSVDVSAWLSGNVAWSARWSSYAQGGVSRTAENPLVHARPRSVAFGTLALNWAATPALTAVVQLDSHGALADSDLNFLKPTLTGTFGGRWRVATRTWFDIGVMEDLATNHSPDVVFYVAVRRNGGDRSALSGP